MTPAEFWWLVTAKQDSRMFSNGMSGAEVRQIYEEAYGNI
jgi:hypothetical protein